LYTYIIRPCCLFIDIVYPPPLTYPHSKNTHDNTGGGLPLQPAVNARGLLLDEGPLESERLPPPAKFKLLSSLGRARVMGAFTVNQFRCEMAALRFSRAEVEAVKAKAMAGLEGARVCVWGGGFDLLIPLT
jgi:hypothetical protein